MKAAEGIRTLDIHVGKAGESAVSATYWVPEYAEVSVRANQVQGCARFGAAGGRGQNAQKMGAVFVMIRRPVTCNGLSQI